MRITLDATPLLGPRTGIGRYVHHLLAELPGALARRGVAGDLRATTWTARGAALTQLPAGVRQVGPRVPARVLRELWRRTDLPPIEALVGRTDVFHGTNFVSPPTRRAREVLTVHDLTYVHHAGTVSSASLLYRELVPRALRRGAVVVTPSRAVADAVRSHYALPDDAVHPTPLGVDDAWFAAQPPSARRRAELGLPDDYLLFVGSLDPRKNLPALLRAFEAVRRTTPDAPALVLAGPAGRETALAAQDGVHLTGWLADADLRDVVAGCRALVLPSLDEGFGLPVLEALACGRPVVAADIPALREVAGDLAVLACPTDDDALADALTRVLTAPDGDDERARRRARAQTFTWAACADRTLDVYGAA
ncbi:glycosyltransferase family 1 protein [uncultured Cellulomonas sp.]|uniref:glycosyltransferase family 4 protein n=1 Tax=uncultured Cellulomonas sp. TaxID=189682 RepID=UPI0026145FE0|nr:glycosyltransferase family 1 protein [uncultured Cellulomonas sp.]